MATHLEPVAVAPDAGAHIEADRKIPLLAKLQDSAMLNPLCQPSFALAHADSSFTPTRMPSRTTSMCSKIGCWQNSGSCRRHSPAARGCHRSDLSKLLSLVETKQSTFVEAWNEFFHA
jgi:hypothetical protein